MKEIYKYVKDESLKKKLKEVQGIGTEATRATIIQELIQRKFLTTEARRSTSSRRMTPTSSSIPCPMKCSIPTKRLSGRTALSDELGKDKLDTFLHDQLFFLDTLVTAARKVSCT